MKEFLLSLIWCVWGGEILCHLIMKSRSNSCIVSLTYCKEGSGSGNRTRILMWMKYPGNHNQTIVFIFYYFFMVWSAWVAISSAYLLSQNNRVPCMLVDGKEFCQTDDGQIIPVLWYTLLFIVFIIIYMIIIEYLAEKFWYQGFWIRTCATLIPLTILSFYLIYLW